METKTAVVVAPNLVIDLDLTLLQTYGGARLVRLAKYFFQTHSRPEERKLSGQQAVPLHVEGVSDCFLVSLHPSDDLDVQLERGDVLIVCVRPGARTFLQGCKSGWRCILVTQSTADYAQTLVRLLLDPDGSVFGDRIVAKEKLEGDPQKSLKRVAQCVALPCAEQTLIVDDNPSAWVPENARMVLFALPFTLLDKLESLDEEKKTIEGWVREHREPDCILAALQEPIEDALASFQTVRQRRIDRSSTEPVDLSVLMRLQTSRILEGTKICFLALEFRARAWASAFLPSGMSLEAAVQSMGGTMVDFDSLADVDRMTSLTHALTCPEETLDRTALSDAFSQMEQYDIPVLHLSWLLVAVAHHTQPKEEHFTVSSDGKWTCPCIGLGTYDVRRATAAYAKRMEVSTRAPMLTDESD